MKQNLSARETWAALVAGEDVGPMVSPLCDNWSLDIPYRWPYDDPDPFPPGHAWHTLSQQMAMAGVCGWTPSFVTGLPFSPRNSDIEPQTSTSTVNGVSRTETRIRTPYGDLTGITESKVSSHTVKSMLTTEEDYKRMAWLARERMNYDEDSAVRAGQIMRKAGGERGVLGTWSGPPICSVDRDNMFYHLADWPAACEELRQASMQAMLKFNRTLHAAGFDFLFYCVDGTEWISPDFFRDRFLADTLLILKEWRALGGFVLWHSCGHVKQLIEAGFYNECLPEVFETLSEPPVGNLPSLRWARERLDRRIVTKGNMPLGVLLNGSEDEVRAEVRRIREETRGYRHIVGLSDDVLNNTPLRNIKAYVDEGTRP